MGSSGFLILTGTNTWTMYSSLISFPFTRGVKNIDLNWEKLLRPINHLQKDWGKLSSYRLRL